MKNYLLAAPSLALLFASSTETLASSGVYDLYEIAMRRKAETANRPKIAEVQEPKSVEIRGIGLSASTETSEVGDKFIQYKSSFVKDAQQTPVIFKLEERDLFTSDSGIMTLGAIAPKNKDTYTILKILGPRAGLLSTDRLVTLNSYFHMPDNLKCEKFLVEDLAGLIVYAHEPWLYSPANSMLSSSIILCSTDLYQINGSLTLEADELILGGCIWPHSNLVIRSLNKNCPIEEITLWLANNQYPMKIAGKIIFSDKPVIEIEHINVGLVDIKYNRRSHLDK